jgi:pimeloyl-ACP methyl ester carboxylesterase
MMQDMSLYASESLGLTTRYVRAGSASPVVLLIHGMGCSSLEWSENIPHLSAQMTVIAVDLIGFGQSDKPIDFDYSPRSQAKQLMALMDELGIEAFHVVGNSFGGRVAIEMAAQMKDRVQSLTLVASAGGGLEAPRSLRIASIPLLGELLYKPTYANFKKGWQAAFFDPSKLTEDRVLKKYQDCIQPGARRGHLQTLRSMLNIWGFKRKDFKALDEKVKRLQCRTLIVAGAQDVFIPVAHAYHFKNRIAHATLVVYDQCGHAPQIEKSEAFNPLLEDFILCTAPRASA